MTNKFSKFDFFAIVLIILSSLILLLDTLIYKGQPANMDGVAHITHIAVFHKALKSGDFPVRWTDGFANYGLPIGSFAQQFTSYAGAFLTFLTNDVIVSFNLVYVIGTLFSVVLFYIFLRFYFNTWPSFVGAFLFNFAPYRIINFYIRGTLPEYFSSVFLVSILIFLYLLFKKKSKWAYMGLTLSTFGMILTHPMNALTGSIIIAPYYFLFLLAQEKNKVKMILVSASSVLLGVLLSSYYIIPLLRDIKYFYYGSGTNHYNASYLALTNFFDPNWYYSLVERNEILSRGHFIKTGLLEILIFITGLIFVFIKKIKESSKKITFLDITLLAGLASLFLTTKYSEFLYENINILSNIQFPWRMLSTFIFVPPIVAAVLLNKINKKRNLSILIGFGLVFITAWTRFPEVYGKNFTKFPQDHYYFTVDNIHSANMNTIWTAETTSYEVHKDEKVAILEGEATLEKVKVKNSSREFNIDAKSEVKMIDYTFYFPGWKVFIDGLETPIEFQDVNHRGVITYKVPAGKHNVEVVFKSTKTVLLGNYLSVLAGIVVLIICFKPIVPKK